MRWCRCGPRCRRITPGELTNLSPQLTMRATSRQLCRNNIKVN